MKIIKPSFEIIDQDNHQNFDNTASMKHVETCGRICWVSGSRTTPDSYKSFWTNIVEKKQHRSITEHAAITRIIPKHVIEKLHNKMLMDCEFNLLKFFKMSIHSTNLFYYMTGNLRAWYDLADSFIHPEILSPENVFNIEKIREEFPDIYYKHRLVTIKFRTDLGISHELVRHRIMSFSQESSRYNNYSENGKHSGMTFIDIDSAKPFFKLKNVGDNYEKGMDYLTDYLNYTEICYNDLANCGFPAEWIRAIMPKIAKTEIIVSAFVEDWWKFFDLRTSEFAHPQMRQIVIPLKEEFKNRGWIKNYD